MVTSQKKNLKFHFLEKEIRFIGNKTSYTEKKFPKNAKYQVQLPIQSAFSKVFSF